MIRINAKLAILFICICNLFSAANSYQFDPVLIQEDINTLNERLNKNFWSKDVKYTIGTWQKSKGIYKSAVHMNTLDKSNSLRSNWLRENFQIDDINMFVTAFVLYGAIQASQLGTIKIDPHQFSQSLQAVSKFKDKNVDYGIPQYVFWQQTNVNGTWSATPKNLINFINTIPQPPKIIDPVLEALGLGILIDFKIYTKVFIIPADNDDSSVSLALLGFMKQTNSSHFKFWDTINFKKQQYYQQALKFAYRPFESNYSLNPQADQIDPRTYFNYYEFINMKKQQAVKAGKQPSLILPTTWLLNKKQQVKGVVVMPFETNNVDATVCANFIFGLSFQLLNKQIIITPQLQKMVLDTTQLLAYVVKNRILKRPDLVLVYYPSKYDFYWFLARIVQLYKRQTQPLPKPLDQVNATLYNLMKNQVTDHILAAKNLDKNNFIYWNQFLGNYANKNRNDDAFFSTSVALNALLDTWTTRINNKVTYDDDLPTQVQQIIRCGASFLRLAVRNQMKESNAFFSGSLKQYSTYPILYPANIHTDGTGNNIDPQNTNINHYSYDWKYYVKGFIGKQDYQKLIAKKWFGYDVPMVDPGLNFGKGITFPYWSSEAITEMMSITSLSKFLRAQQSLKK